MNNRMEFGWAKRAVANALLPIMLLAPVTITGCGKGNQAQTDAAKDSAGKDAGKGNAAASNKEKLIGKWTGKIRIDKPALKADMQKTKPDVTDQEVQERYGELYDKFDIESTYIFEKDGTFLNHVDQNGTPKSSDKGKWEAGESNGQKINVTLKTARSADGQPVEIEFDRDTFIHLRIPSYYPPGVELYLGRSE